MPESVADDERRLAEALEASVLRRTGRADAVASLAQRSVGADLYSYETRLVEARYASGARETVFLKDFAGSRLPKDEPLRRRRERELAVYERLLPESSLGVPDYIGKVWDESLDRFWLLIEYVPGVELGYRPFERWIDAAAWLGRFHAYADARPELVEHPALARHDEEFFGQHGRAARATLGRVSDELARRFAPVADVYDAVTRRVWSGPETPVPTLVHGAFRPHNILVDDATDRVAPIDWESAAVGTRFHDFGCLADGFTGSEWTGLRDAYVSAAASSGLSAPSEREMRFHCAHVSMHRTMYWLGMTIENGDSPERTAGIVDLAERLCDALRESADR